MVVGGLLLLRSRLALVRCTPSDVPDSTTVLPLLPVTTLLLQWLIHTAIRRDLRRRGFAVNNLLLQTTMSIYRFISLQFPHFLTVTFPFWWFNQVVFQRGGIRVLFRVDRAAQSFLFRINTRRLLKQNKIVCSWYGMEDPMEDPMVIVWSSCGMEDRMVKMCHAHYSTIPWLSPD